MAWHCVTHQNQSQCGLALGIDRWHRHLARISLVAAAGFDGLTFDIQGRSSRLRKGETIADDEVIDSRPLAQQVRFTGNDQRNIKVQILTLEASSRITLCSEGETGVCRLVWHKVRCSASLAESYHRCSILKGFGRTNNGAIFLQKD